MKKLLKSKNKVPVILAVAALLLVGSGAPVATVAAEPPVLYGKVYDPPRVAFDFALPASIGQRVHLRDYRGQVVLVYFGYTYCPDVCPTTLADVKQALHQLGPLAQGVTLLFVSVDPARDTPARLAEYLGYFHEPGYVGLSGGETETAQIAYQYGAKFYREETPASTGGYSVAHTTRLFLVGRQGQWVMSLPFGTTPDQLAADLRYWLAQ
ncbi:MAG: SCO family protein [Caldilineaceae bacterium]